MSFSSSSSTIAPHFQHIRTVDTALPNCSVTEYFSTFSGLRIFVIDVESPITHGIFVLPTEAEDDDGLPHTLEHLIFLGSNDYPLKGVLDTLAARCLANGTNAWTDVDHTAYTVSTAGTEGFLTLLPVYLDHILRPTLDDDSFLTEVHHINGEGKSSGVVFSEMQSVQNQAERLQEREALNYLYPGKSGYKCSTGGIMNSIRETTNEKIKAFHKKFYKWDNLSLIICGKVDVSKLLNIVGDVEVHQKGSWKGGDMVYEYQNFFEGNGKLSRPWQDEENIAPLQKSTCKSITFPVDEEESGNVAVFWRGPYWSCFEDVLAITLLGAYLTETNLSPLQKSLVEIAKPYCSDVHFSLEKLRSTLFYLECTDVPYDSNNTSKNLIETALPAVEKALKDVVNEGIDMQRMQSIIKLESRLFLLSIENDPLATLGQCLIEYCINADKSEQLNQQMNVIDIYNNLMKRDEEYWLEMFKKYFIDAPNVQIKSIPSMKRKQDIELEEKEFQNKQKKLYGETKLQEMEEMMKCIKEKQGKKISDELIKSFPLADVREVKMIPQKVYRNFNCMNGELDMWNDVIKKSVSFPLQINDIPTNFIYTKAIFSIPPSCTAKQMELIPLLLDLLFESDVEINGKPTDHKIVTSLLVENTVSYGADVCMHSKHTFPHCVRVEMVASITQYFEAMNVLMACLFNVLFTPERVAITLKSSLSGLQESKRKPKTALDIMECNTRLTKNCCLNCYGVPHQEKRLKGLKNNMQHCITELTELYRELFKVENLRIHVSTDLRKMPVDWMKCYQTICGTTDNTTPSSLRLDRLLHQSIVEDGRLFEAPLRYGNAVLCGLGSTEASYLRFQVPCARGYMHPDMPALYVLCEAFSMSEGPLYRLTRGGGLSYGTCLSHRPMMGVLCLWIGPSNNVSEALKKCMNCFQSYVEGDALSYEEVESAKSVAIYSIIEREKTHIEASSETFVNAVKGVAIDYNKQLIQKIVEVTAEDVKRVVQLYLSALTSIDVSDKYVCGKSLMMIANSGEADEIAASLSNVLRLNVMPYKTFYRFVASNDEEDYDEDEASDDEASDDEASDDEASDDDSDEEV